MPLCLDEGTEILQLTIFVNCKMSLCLCEVDKSRTWPFSINCKISPNMSDEYEETQISQLTFFH